MRRPFAYLRRRPVVAGVALVAAVAVVAVLLSRLPLSDVAAASADARPHMLLVAVAFMFGTGLMNSVVLHRALTAAGIAPRYERTYLVQAVSHGLASCAPAAAVDACRVWMLRGEAPVGRAIGALGSQKIIEALGALCVVAAAGPFLELPAGGPFLSWAPLGALCCVAALIALVGGTPLGGRIGRLLPDGPIGRVVGQVAAGARSLAQTRALLALVGAQAAALACRIGALWALLGAFSITTSLMGAVLVFVVLMVASLVPSIGGVGAREAALVPALIFAFGVPTAEAFAFSLWIQTMGLTTAAALLVPHGAYRAARACVVNERVRATP